MTPANDNRPAEFDALVLRYIPGLNAFANRLRPNASADKKEELVQDTLCKAFAAWRYYRPGSTPLPWLKFLMRAINRDDILRIDRQKAVVSQLTAVPFQASLPNQEHAADLSFAIANITPSLREDMLEVAQGGDMAEIGRRRGVSRERVRQIFQAERASWTGYAQAA